MLLQRRAEELSVRSYTEMPVRVNMYRHGHKTLYASPRAHVRKLTVTILQWKSKYIFFTQKVSISERVFLWSVVCFFVLLSRPRLKTVKLIQLHNARVSVLTSGASLGPRGRAWGHVGGWAGLSAHTGVNRVQTSVRVSRKIALHARGLTATTATLLT